MLQLFYNGVTFCKYVDKQQNAEESLFAFDGLFAVNQC